jgi:hypothetical protein
MAVSREGNKSPEHWTGKQNLVISQHGTAKELEMPSTLIDPDKTTPGAYKAPRLTIYGDAKALTASGSGATAENDIGGGNCQASLTKKPC